jgi:hypothetical protein
LLQEAETDRSRNIIIELRLLFDLFTYETSGVGLCDRPVRVCDFNSWPTEVLNFRQILLAKFLKMWIITAAAD